MSQLQLEGEVQYGDSNDLRQQIVRLEDELGASRRELTKAKAELNAGKQALEDIRNQLHPLYRSLRLLFGDIESVIGNTPINGSPSAPQFDPKWDAWKQKLGSGTAPARVIDALLTHGPMTRTQLRQAGELGWSTLDAATSRLRNLSLIEKVGDRWQLKG